MNSLSLFSFLFLVSTALACKCVPPTVEKTYCTADYIARVKITATSQDARDTTYVFDEVKKFKGDNESHKQLKTPLHSATCGISKLNVGGEYLLALREKNNALTASACLGFPAENAALGSVEWKNVPGSLLDTLEKNPPKC